MTLAAHPAESRFIVVEQISRAQWHAFDPDTGWRTGVMAWPDAVSNALWAAILTRGGVQSIDLDRRRLTLLTPEVVA